MKKCQPKALTPYLDDELSTDARQQVDEHLRSCASCGALLDEVMAARERVHDMGRAIIPSTVLMPALEAFRERAGMGTARQLSLGDIPAPPAAVPPVAPETAVAAAPGPAEADAAWTAPLARDLEPEPAPGVDDALVDAGPDVEEQPAAASVTWVPVEDRPVEAEPATVIEPEPEPVAELGDWPAPAAGTAQSWETEPGPASVEDVAPAVADEGLSALEELPEAPPPQVPAPWVEAELADQEDIEAQGRRLVEEDLARAAQLEAEGIGAAEPIIETEPVNETEPIVEAQPEPLSYAQPEPILEAEPEPIVEAEPEAIVSEAEPIAEVEREPIVPVAEPMAEMEPEPIPAGPPDEVATAIARMREELGLPGAEPAAGWQPEPEVEESRPVLARSRVASESPLQRLDNQVKIGVAAAAAILLVLAAVLAIPRAFAPRSQPEASTRGHATPATAPTAPAGSTLPSPAPTAATAPSAAPAVPALTGVVTAGAGGSGYHVARIRTGSPAAGVTRIVFDLQGSGPAPDVQLGRGPDGNLYLQAAGITIDPATLQAFPGAGPVSAMSALGPTGMSLKLATAQPPQFSMYYLTGPSRLVLDLK